MDIKNNARHRAFFWWVILISLIFLSFIAVIVIFFLPDATITEYQTVAEQVPYKTEYVDDGALDLGVEVVKQEGIDGEKSVKYKISKKIISGEEISKERVEENTTKSPTPKIVLKGTRRYQYMYCSDGSYYYYKDDVFNNNSNVGYTHSSQDMCLAEGHGRMTRLADGPPTQPTYYDTGGAICQDGTRSYSTGRGACSWHGGVLYWL